MMTRGLAPSSSAAVVSSSARVKVGAGTIVAASASAILRWRLAVAGEATRTVGGLRTLVGLAADPIAAAVCCWLRALLLAFDGAIVCYEKRNEMRLQSMFELAMVEILTKVSFNIIKRYLQKYL